MKLKNLFLASLMTVLSACGGVDPLTLINDNSFPPLDSIIASSFTGLAIPYTSNTPYWQFTAFGAVSYIAPANGIVADIGTASGLSYIRIVHSGRLSTQISGLSTITVRSGDRIAKGQVIGIFSNVPVQFQVLVDGASVCPLSYMSTTFKQTFYAGYTSNPCLN